MTALCLSIVLLSAAASEKSADADADRFVADLQEFQEAFGKLSIARPSRRLLVELALRGLFHGQGKELPPHLEKRLQDEKAAEAEWRQVLRDGYRELGERRRLDEEAALADAIHFTLKRLDPNGTWELSSGFICRLGAFTDGIGARLHLDQKTGLPRVTTPIKDGPAYRAGIRADDVITEALEMRTIKKKVAGAVQPTPTAGLPLDQVERLLLGETGSKVMLTVRRDGVEQPLRMEVTRAAVEDETVLGRRRKTDDSWDFLSERDKKIGYIRLSRFGKTTATDLEKALGDLERQHTRGLILDLRFCPGGLIDTATKAAGLFLVRGALVTALHSLGQKDYDLVVKAGNPRSGLEIVCLVNDETARTAEVLAAALQDYGRATVVGERSQGCCGIRNVLRLDRHELGLTTALMLRPSGKKLDRILLSGRDADECGVTPDAKNLVKTTEKERQALMADLDRRKYLVRRDVKRAGPETVKDRQLERAYEVLKEQMKKDR